MRTINTRLAERYKGHAALAGWHISNEYSGACYCNYCLAAFRAWLKTRYASLDELNLAYWAAFWAQKFQSWDQIDPREAPMDGLALDWDRFVTHQTVDFMKNEVAPLKALTPELPVTTNMMGTFGGLDYWRFTEVCDRMAWDAYPQLDGDWRKVVDLSMIHDMYRSMKGGLPFMLMESTPSVTNWQPTPSLKRPGQHRQEMLIAIGHGADTTMYFQWRKSRGAAEKFHGAVVDHEGSDKTRVFQDVAAHGALLEDARRRRGHDRAARGRARQRLGVALGARPLAGTTPGRRAAGAARSTRSTSAPSPTTTARSGSSASAST